MRERLLVAKAAETQLTVAAEMLRRAVDNLAALKHGIQPGLDAAKKALAECSKAQAHTDLIIKRIPDGTDTKR